MIKITLRYKVALELYASLSLFAAIIILLYYKLSARIGENLYIPTVGIIGFCIIAFIFFLRTLILDVNSAKFEHDESKENANIVEIKVINKVTLEIISTISNFIIIASIFIFGIAKSKGTFSEVLSMAFILFLLIPMITLIKSLIFDFNLLFTNKKHGDNFLNELINRKTILFLFIAIIIIVSISSNNRLVTSVGKLYEKSMTTGEEFSLNIFITSIAGERKNISDAPVTGLNIYLEALDLDFNINSFTVKFIEENTTSTLKYGITADESHFSYIGKTTGKGNAILRRGEAGIITINLSTTKQELYSYDKGTIQVILGNGKTISKDIKTPELKGDSRILLYSST